MMRFVTTKTFKTLEKAIFGSTMNVLQTIDIGNFLIMNAFIALLSFSCFLGLKTLSKVKLMNFYIKFAKLMITRFETILFIIEEIYRQAKSLFLILQTQLTSISFPNSKMLTSKLLTIFTTMTSLQARFCSEAKN